MTTNLPLELVAAVATIVAALITGAITFVNLVLTKEQKTSEFRQSWIDGLRDDLASFVATARLFGRTLEKARLDDDWITFNHKEADLRYKAAETLCKIKLRLNPNEEEHNELLRLLNQAIAEQNNMNIQKTDITTTIKAIDNATEYARPVLKNEWERVKKGEPAFRIARNSAIFIVVLSILSFLFILITY